MDNMSAEPLDDAIVYPHQLNPEVLTPEEEAAYIAISDRVHAGERDQEFAERIARILDNLPEGYHAENGEIVRDDPSLPLVPYLGCTSRSRKQRRST